MNTFPQIRMRRNRQRNIRRLTEQEYPSPQKFIWPVFVIEGAKIIKPIESLPGQFYYSIDMLAEEVKKVCYTAGIGGVMIFGVIENRLRDDKGTYSFNKEGLAQRAIRELRNKIPNLTIFGDIGLTGYTKSGHAQIIKNNKFDNDESLEIIKKVAISHANAGVTGVAPSGMIDGQVKEIRNELDKQSFNDILILSYSTKFNSNMYRTFPFDISAAERGALDRGDYLESYRVSKGAVRESLLDEQEGADMLMVKPALFYLDMIQKIAEKTNLPLVAYNVSGEYAMINAMIEKGYAEKSGLVKESLCSIYRAGADIIISYWANQYNDIFKKL
ncbi:MAG: porphobilinogen synthase [Patescibacteria group bacterium]|nr:porphobilinogen synthase [Patescibacteria group bacterium]MDE1988483.1 porphobilinogen synthase [Patescibacteria group bacterium]MDE2218269.1 porphobilinogen synthase [Patescibacteria group bacterium]